MEDESAPHFAHPFVEQFHPDIADVGRIDIANDDQVLRKERVLVVGQAVEENGIGLRFQIGIALEQDALDLEPAVALKHAEQVAEIPRGLLFHQQHFDLVVDDADIGLGRVVVANGLLRQGRHDGFELGHADGIGRVAKGNFLIAIRAEFDRLFVDDLAVGLELHRGLLAVHALRAHAGDDGEFFLHVGNLRAGQFRHHDVLRRGYANAVNEEGHAVLFRDGGGFNGRGAGVARTIGDEEHARDRLAALLVEQIAQSVADIGQVFAVLHGVEKGSAVGGIQLRVFGRGEFAQFNQLPAKAVELEAGTALQPGPEIEPGIGGDRLQKIAARKVFDRVLRRRWHRLLQSSGGIDQVLRDGRAGDIVRIVAAIVEPHALRDIEEDEERTADGFLQRDEQDGTNQQDQEQAEQNAPQRDQAEAGKLREIRRIFAVAPDRARDEHDEGKESPAPAQSLVTEGILRRAGRQFFSGGEKGKEEAQHVISIG